MQKFKLQKSKMQKSKLQKKQHQILRRFGTVCTRKLNWGVFKSFFMPFYVNAILENRQHFRLVIVITRFIKITCIIMYFWAYITLKQDSSRYLVQKNQKLNLPINANEHFGKKWDGNGKIAPSFYFWHSVGSALATCWGLASLCLPNFTLQH